jgi:hypothetical protein
MLLGASERDAQGLCRRLSPHQLKDAAILTGLKAWPQAEHIFCR